MSVCVADLLDLSDGPDIQIYQCIYRKSTSPFILKTPLLDTGPSDNMRDIFGKAAAYRYFRVCFRSA